MTLLHRCALASLVVALAATGCASDRTEAGDAARADGPVRIGDAATDRPAVAKSDSAAGADATEPDGATDSPASALAPADARGAEHSPSPDQSVADAPAAAEAPGLDDAAPDTSAPDSSRAEDAAGDRPPAADAAGGPDDDADCTGWTTLLRITPEEANHLIATADPIVINVHIPYEGEIPGTDASIPYTDVDAIETYLNYDHCADVLLVCRSGSMSQTAGNALVRRGYLRIRDLKGGFVAWEDAGYPLLKDGGT